MDRRKDMLFNDELKKGPHGMKSMLQSRFEDDARSMISPNGLPQLKMWDAQTGEVLAEWESPDKKIENIMSEDINGKV